MQRTRRKDEILNDYECWRQCAALLLLIILTLTGAIQSKENKTGGIDNSDNLYDTSHSCIVVLNDSTVTVPDTNFLEVQLQIWWQGQPIVCKDCHFFVVVILPDYFFFLNYNQQNIRFSDHGVQS